MTGRWYRPGDALALVTGVGVVVTDPGHEAMLTALFEEPLKVPGIVEALTARGWAAVPDFACVVVEGDEVRVLVRGRPRVEIAGEVLEGHGATTWTERAWERTQVDSVVLLGGDIDETLPTDDVPRLPIEAGLVRASRVEWLIGAAPIVAAVEPQPAPQVAEPEPEPQPAPPVAPQLAPDSPATIIEPDEHEFDAMFGVTVPGRRPEDAAVRPIETDLDDLAEEDVPAVAPAAPTQPAPSRPAAPAPAPMTTDTGDHDGRTVARGSLPQRPARTPGAPAPRGPLVTLNLSTGESYDVGGRALVGRSPRSTAATGTALPQLVVVDDPYVSSTHLEIAVSAATVLVTDVSTNGTTLTPLGGSEGVLVRDVPTDVGDGAVLRLSDDLTIVLWISSGINRGGAS